MEKSAGFFLVRQRGRSRLFTVFTKHCTFFIRSLEFKSVYDRIIMSETNIKGVIMEVPMNELFQEFLAAVPGTMQPFVSD